jgi:predicted nucleic acid-binding protein
MRPSIYLETSIVGYLTSRPSRDLVTAANQQITRDWWEQHRAQYDLYISQAVAEECGAGDPAAAEERLQVLTGIPALDVTEEADRLAAHLLREIPLPENASIDAVHIAVATVHGIDYLLTWNCTHIANAALKRRIEVICRAAGFDPPTICTPQQLMEA